MAAIDLGTNSFHLLVADVHPDGHIDPIVREKEMLRLGDVVSRHGHIPSTAADQAVATVRRFRLLAEAASTDEILARATSAIRRATNGADVVDRIEEETGVAGRRDQRPRGGPPHLRRRPRLGGARPRRPRSASTSAAAASR